MIKIPMVFPGQASQFVGMAQDLTEPAGPAAEFLARIDDTLGYSLTRIMFEGPLDTLTETHHAQPAILAHSVALVLALREQGISPSIVAGHSLGEFSAAVASGALLPEDALSLVRRRGELMFAAGQESPGTMAAVMGLPAEKVIEICGEVTAQIGTVCLANHNSENQVVISGEVEAVAAAGSQLTAAGAKRVIGLQVSGAFHSPLLAEAAARFATALEEIPIAPPAVPLVANFSGRAVDNAADLGEGFRRQLTAPVLWRDCLAGVVGGAEDGEPAAVVLEVGPGKVLTNLAKRVFPQVSFRPVASRQDLESVRDFLGDREN